MPPAMSVPSRIRANRIDTGEGDPPEGVRRPSSVPPAAQCSRRSGSASIRTPRARAPRLAPGLVNGMSPLRARDVPRSLAFRTDPPTRFSVPEPPCRRPVADRVPASAPVIELVLEPPSACPRRAAPSLRAEAGAAVLLPPPAASALNRSAVPSRESAMSRCGSDDCSWASLLRHAIGSLDRDREAPRRRARPRPRSVAVCAGGIAHASRRRGRG